MGGGEFAFTSKFFTATQQQQQQRSCLIEGPITQTSRKEEQNPPMNSMESEVIVIDDSSSDDGWNDVPSRQNKKKMKSPLPDVEPCTPSIMMLCGIPGSGKSKFAEMLISVNPLKFERISQDVLGTRNKCERACKAALRNGKIAIIDRCNFNAQQRLHFTSIAVEFNVPVDCIVFQYSREVSRKQ